VHLLALTNLNKESKTSEKDIYLLLVEDNQEHAQIISALIKREIENIKVFVVNNHDEACRTAEQTPMDVMLTDYRIGHMDCFQIIDDLHAHAIPLPFIILTGQGNEGVAAQSIKRGAEDYLIKDQIFQNPSIMVKAIYSAVEKSQLRKALKESEELYRTLVQNIQDGVFIVRDDRLIFINPAFYQILDISYKTLRQTKFSELFEKDQQQEVLELMQRAEEAGVSAECGLVIRRMGVRDRIFTELTLSSCNYKGSPALIGSLKDVTSRILADKKLKETLAEKNRLSITDELTGIFNRRHALYTLDQELKRARRYNSTLSMIMLDLDKLKDINDNYGHLYGDESLSIVANILMEEIRDTDMAARYGGDEFILILPESNIHQATTLGERICDKVMSRRLQLDEDSYVGLSVSIGIAEAHNKCDDLVSLIRRADDNLRSAKNLGRNRVIA
jgi:diguanylate cyclase (GGDEF)-like protein/PAS domain S-box-containing protein